MKEIFYELIKEASNTSVNIDGEEWPIGFNSNIEGEYLGSENNLSTLVINNKEEFFNYLGRYIEKELELNRRHLSFVFDARKNHMKSIMAYLFVNMSTEDFLNPVACLKRRIAFLEDKTFSLLDEERDFSLLPNAKVRVKQNMQSIYMETPYIFDVSVIDGEEEYKLPYISYGICEENDKKVCYVYSIMNHSLNVSGKEDSKDLAKRVNRSLYKLNKGVLESESQEFKDYLIGNDEYYPENVTDVTPSFVYSLLVFLKCLQDKGIEDIKAVPYLPVRYLSRDIAAKNTKDENIRKQREERNYNIQKNATDKFIRTFKRAAFHMKELEIISEPYEVDESLNMRLRGREGDKAIGR